MKTIVFMVCFFGATLAFGQASYGGAALSNEATVFEMPNHPQRASRQHMDREQDLREDSDVISGHGERPLWEVAPKKRKEIPLGDIARELKKEHETAKKSETIWEN